MKVIIQMENKYERSQDIWQQALKKEIDHSFFYSIWQKKKFKIFLLAFTRFFFLNRKIFKYIS